VRHLILIVALAAALTACGRRGPIEHSEGTVTDYPRIYPAR
jgi:predicted small lipoprotein YifL